MTSKFRSLFDILVTDLCDQTKQVDQPNARADLLIDTIGHFCLKSCFKDQLEKLPNFEQFV